MQKGIICEDASLVGLVLADWIPAQKNFQTLLMTCVSCSWAPCSSRPQANLPMQ